LPPPLQAPARLVASPPQTLSFDKRSRDQ
jgi:hypothetical protein